MELFVKKLNRTLSPTEEYLYGMLDEKFKQRLHCENDLVFSNGQKIEPPPVSISFNDMFNNVFGLQTKKDVERNCTHRRKLIFVPVRACAGATKRK